MSSHTAMLLMFVAEVLVRAVLCVLFWRKGLRRRFPAMGAYLVLQATSEPLLLLLFQGQTRHWFGAYSTSFYFIGWWLVYIASFVLYFFICIEIFRSVFAIFPRMVQVVTSTICWALFASAFVIAASVFFFHKGEWNIAEALDGTLHSMSVIAMCLIGFLFLCMNALRIPVRDMAYGLALGFAVLSTNDFVQWLFSNAHTSLIDSIQFIGEIGTFLGIGVWVAYVVLPEPADKPVVLPASSIICRWNEIASALGHNGTKVAVRHPASGIFLNDVEKVVDEVFTRNLKSRESEI